MKQLLYTSESPRNQLQFRLLLLAAIAIFLASIILTFAPVVRMHSWETELRWQHWIGFIVWLAGFTVLIVNANRFFPDRDTFLLPIIALLSGWGLLTIFRLSPASGFRQTAWLAIAMTIWFFAFRIRNLLGLLRRYKYVWLAGGIILTVLTFFIGTYPGGGGPELWLSLGNVYFQPSEFLKLLLIIYLAAYLADAFPARFRLLQLLIPTLILSGIVLVILIAQRDLGTASIFLVLYTVIIYLATGKRRILLFSFLISIAAVLASYLVFDVIQVRIAAWINPWSDPRGSAYQIVQSLIAIANGKVLGAGIGLGSPGVVPVATSDFIFPAILEEHGFAGGVVLSSILAIFTIRGLTISLHAPNQYQRFLAAGLTTYLATQSVLIMGGTIRMLPLTGVTLPFMSYGGSSLVTSFVSVFLLMMISNQAEDRPAEIERAKPYQLVGSLFVIAFTLIALISGWWGVVNSRSLLGRSDNPRRAISDRYVTRGNIYDQNNLPLTTNTGEKGSYIRRITYSPISSVIGYSDPNYGQTGIESAMDGYLRGIYPGSENNVTLSRLLYAQYPPGIDLRLSLDLAMQQKADALLTGLTGSVLVMNPESGEVLVMATSPSFDANELETMWETWMADERAPLLNRATMAQYPPGTTLGSILLARYLSRNDVSINIPNLNWSTDFGDEYFCAILPGNKTTWGKLLSSGCIAPLLQLSQSIQVQEFFTLLKEIGLGTIPDLPLEVTPPTFPSSISSYEDLFTGKDELLVSPLQVALMASVISNGGQKVEPLILTGYKTLENSWQLFADQSVRVPINNLNTQETSSKLTLDGGNGWEISTYAQHQEASVSWYVSGTPQVWSATPMVVVVALEDGSALQAKAIGRGIFQYAFNQFVK